MKWIPSPNFTKGRGGKVPEIVVIHVMAGSLSGTDAWFQNPKSQVSAHYGIGLDGTVHQYVSEDDTAWANGRVSYPTSKVVKAKGGNPNAYSISIEHEGDDLSKGTKAQWDASSALIDEICTRWKILKDREHVIGHYEIFSGKPSCPATDKSIIDRLITKEEVMEKSFVEAIEKLVGKDYGDNLNEKEQKDAAGKIDDKRKELEAAGQLEVTNKRLMENNTRLAEQITAVDQELALLRTELEQEKAKADGNAENTSIVNALVFFIKAIKSKI